MRTGIVESVKRAVDIEEGERLPLRIHHPPLSHRDVGSLSDADAGTHAVTGSPRPARCHSRSSPAFFTPTSK